jgi:DNA-binding NarL/FixJ family response regulator
MLGQSRVKVVERLCAAWPASKILLHILPEDKGALRQLVEHGVAGYLLKCSSADELVGAIRAVAGAACFLILRNSQTPPSFREKIGLGSP